MIGRDCVRAAVLIIEQQQIYLAILVASQAINRDYFTGKTGQMLTTSGPL